MRRLLQTRRGRKARSGFALLGMAAIGVVMAAPASAVLTLQTPQIVLLPNGTTAYDPAASGANFRVNTGAQFINPGGVIGGGATRIRITS